MKLKAAKAYANKFVAIPREHLKEWQEIKAEDFLAGAAYMQTRILELLRDMPGWTSATPGEVAGWLSHRLKEDGK